MKKLKNVNKYSFDYLKKRLLRIIKDNQEWMIANPKALQWLFCHWESIHMAGRICYGYHGIIAKKGGCEDNPKYEVQGMFDEDPPDTIYDAFANSVDSMSRMIENSSLMGDGPLLAGTKHEFNYWRSLYNLAIALDDKSYFYLYDKLNKTFDDWLALKTNNGYRYKRNYNDVRRVADTVLAHPYGKKFWNQDGFIDIDNQDETYGKFYGWQLESVDSFPENIQEIIEEIIYCDKVQNAIEVAQAHVLERNQKRQEENSSLLNMDDDKIQALMAIIRSKIANGDLKINLDDDKGAPLSNEDILDEVINHVKVEYKYYDFTKDSAIMNMPENAHMSYILAAQVVVEHVLNNQDLYKKERELATIKFAKNWYNQLAVINAGIKISE